MAVQHPAKKQSRFVLTRNAGGVNVLVTNSRPAASTPRKPSAD